MFRKKILKAFFNNTTSTSYPYTLSLNKLFVMIYSYKKLELIGKVDYELWIHEMLYIAYEKGYSIYSFLTPLSNSDALVSKVKSLNKSGILNIELTDELLDNETKQFNIISKIVKYIDENY